MGLLLGLKLSIRAIKSIAYLGVSGLNHYFIDFVLNWFIEFIIVSAVSEFKDKISYLLGFPVKDIILSNWFSVEFPGNIGFPINNSPNMHPILQISADLS